MYNESMFSELFGDTVVNEASTVSNVKNYADCYLYSKGPYEKEIFNFVMHAKYLDKNNEGYKELVDDVKRQKVTNSLAKVLTSNNTILCTSDKPMPRAFKVFVAKDVKGDKKTLKLFIDVTGLVDSSKTKYEYRNNALQIIISYLLAGMNSMIYYVKPEKIVNSTDLTQYGCKCFSFMMAYIIDYLRLSGDPSTRSKILYLSSMYYQIALLGKDHTDTVENWACKVSGLSINEAKLIELRIKSLSTMYKDINGFVQALSEYLKAPDLTVDVIVEKWMWCFGTGTQFGLELYPAFANMLIYAYVGAYLNNQKTIEKIVGKPMVDFVSQVIRIGSDLI